MERRNIQDGSRMRKKAKRSQQDRISDLPELVISHILSLLPTKDAVRTSVLSKDWEYKWTSIRRVVVDDKVCYMKQIPSFSRKKSTMAAVVNFVERVLLHSHNITNFCLSLSNYIRYDNDRIARWICAVSKGKIESLIVSFKYPRCDVLLPCSLLHTTSLRNLELKLPCTFKVPVRISFPNLKNLMLYRVKIVSDSSSNDTLTLAFPLLEKFTQNQCEVLNVRKVEVQAPALTTFISTDTYFTQADNSITITSTRLVEFRYEGDVSVKFILIGQRVLYATLSYRLPMNTEEGLEAVRMHAQTLLNGFPNLKELNIIEPLTEAIARSAAGISIHVLHHLSRLDVSFHTNVKGLLGLLHVTPFLKFLKIYMFVDGYDCDEVERVPLCIQDQLEEIEFKYFDESLFQLSFVKFLLKNGGALKKVRVSCSRRLTKNERSVISTRLSTFSSRPTSLTFVFS